MENNKHKLLIWGTGRLTGKVVGPIISMDSIEGFVDNNENIKEYMGKPVLHPTELKYTSYDALIVCNLFSKEIHKQCADLGLNLEKNIYLYNNCKVVDLNTNYDFVKSILGDEYTQVIKRRYHLVRDTEAFGELCFANAGFKGKNYTETDYVRIRCLELVVKEIRKRQITGSIAEAGVFRGEFAQFLNYAFPDSKLYLFDTFEGFDDSEAIREIKKGNAAESFVEAYKTTNIKMVLEKMPNPEKIEVKKGFFPQTAYGIEDKFAFVSIDFDFEESIYEAVKFFYPKVKEGGFLFVHDYNSSLKGVEVAVDRYEKETGYWLKKVPICDANGTLVITK